MQPYQYNESNPDGRRPSDNAQSSTPRPQSQSQHMLPPLDSMVAGVSPYSYGSQPSSAQISPAGQGYQFQDRPMQDAPSYTFSSAGEGSSAQSRNVVQFSSMNSNSAASESQSTQFRYSITTGPNPNPEAHTQQQRQQPPPSQYQHHQAQGGSTSSSHGRMSVETIAPSSARPVGAGPSAAMPKSTWVKNLLGAHRQSALEGIDFKLTVRQQPRAARACGYGDRDRRVLDPPPIVQLSIIGPNMTEDDRRLYLRYPTYVMSCAIYDESGTRDAAYIDNEYPARRRIMGTLIASPFVGMDEHDVEGCFFCFPDVSCRTPGAFRLQFTLMMLDPPRAATVRHFPTIAETQTEVFHVYSAKEFPGMVASSDLAKRLREQGCIISIKKGNERGRNTRTRNAGSDEEDDNE